VLFLALLCCLLTPIALGVALSNAYKIAYDHKYCQELVGVSNSTQHGVATWRFLNAALLQYDIYYQNSTTGDPITITGLIVYGPSTSDFDPANPVFLPSTGTSLPYFTSTNSYGDLFITGQTTMTSLQTYNFMNDPNLYIAILYTSAYPVSGALYSRFESMC